MGSMEETLYRIFEGTLAPEKPTRDQAEAALVDLGLRCPELPVHLLSLATAPLLPGSGGGGGNGAHSNTAGGGGDAGFNAGGYSDPVQLAAAVRLRNTISRSNWNRPPKPAAAGTAVPGDGANNNNNNNDGTAISGGVVFVEEAKEALRQRLVPALCQPHVGERVRRQLLAAAEAMMEHDYPQRWPALVPQLTSMITECAQAVSTHDQQQHQQQQQQQQQGLTEDAEFSALRRLGGVLGAMRCCCRLYTNPLRVSATDCLAFSAEVLPLLLQLQELLVPCWRRRAEAVAVAAAAGGGLAAPRSLNDLFEFDLTLSGLTRCCRLTLKCVYSLCAGARWPACLREADRFRAFYACMIGDVLEVTGRLVLPLSRARLLAYHGIDDGDGGDGSGALSSFLEAPRGGDHMELFQHSELWVLFKWVLKLCLYLLQEMARPQQCERAARAAATVFRDEYLPTVAEVALAVVRWHASPFPLTSKPFIFALEVLTLAAEHKALYARTLHPNAEELMTALLFPRLAFSSDDQELWAMNPEEYIRKQTSPKGDLYSARVNACGLLLTLAAPTRKFHDPQLLHALVGFIMNQLQVYSPAAAAATAEDADTNVVATEAARRVDAALYCLFQLKRVLFQAQYGDANVEHVLTTFVVPAAGYPLGFLRARAVLVLGVFAPRLSWSSAEAYQRALLAVLPLLADPEIPVQVQTCKSFARLICRPYARPVIEPRVAQLVQQYFEVMRVMDSEGAVRTLRRTIAYYQATLPQWGADLAELIVAHFATVLQTVRGGYAALEEMRDPLAIAAAVADSERRFGRDGLKEGGEDDGGDDGGEDDDFDNVLFAADELLVTLTTLVSSLPPSTGAEDLNTDVYVRIQRIVGPMLHVVLSHQGGSTFGFMDPVLELLTTLLARSPAVTEWLWRLVPCLYNLVMHQGALDYFAQMVAPLDNYISVAPLSFLFTPLEQLCVGDVSDGGGANDSHSSGAAAAATAAAVAAALPADLRGGTVTAAGALHRMCAAALASGTLRNREVAAVPQLYDSLLQNYWAQAALGLAAESGVAQLPPVSAVAAAAVRAVLVAAATRPRQSPTLRLLFCDTVLSAALADPGATLGVLAEMGAVVGFWEQYVYLARGEEVLPLLRPYDRALLAHALAAVLPFASATDGAAAASPERQQLHAALCGVVESGLVTAYASAEVAAARKEHALHQKRIAKRTNAAAAAGAGGGAEGGEVWTDDEDDSDNDGDSDSEDETQWAGVLGAGGRLGGGSGGLDAEGGCGEEADEEEDEDWDDEGDDAADAAGDGQLQSLVRQAREARLAGGDGGDGDAADDDGEMEENLLADDDFTSPIDVTNAWEYLRAAFAQRQESLDPLAAAWQASGAAQAVAQAAEATSALLAIRQQAQQLGI